jgi:hypothetical protein
MALRTKWTSDQIALLQQHYPQMGSACATIIGRTPQQVMKKACKLGVKISVERKTQKCTENAKKSWSFSERKVSHQFFSNCSTKESAYLLGILWADGYLNCTSQHYTIRLEIVARDAIKILPIFAESGNWLTQVRTRKNRKKQMRISTSQQPLYEFLKECDYENKSTVAPSNILSRIPKSLHNYWWRGYFDGDGCFYFNKKNKCRQLSIAGSFTQDWTECEILMQSLGIKYTITRRKQHRKGKTHFSSTIRITNKVDIIKFGEYLYGETYDNIGLARKYKKYTLIRHDDQLLSLS